MAKRRATPKPLKLIHEAQDLLDKCKFLVRRSEFLYQQGLAWHGQAQELINDCAVSGKHVSAMSEKIDRLLGRPKTKLHSTSKQLILPKRPPIRKRRGKK